MTQRRGGPVTDSTGVKKTRDPHPVRQRQPGGNVQRTGRDNRRTEKISSSLPFKNLRGVIPVSSEPPRQSLEGTHLTGSTYEWTDTDTGCSYCVETVVRSEDLCLRVERRCQVIGWIPEVVWDVGTLQKGRTGYQT